MVKSKKWEFASLEWCECAAGLGVKLLEDANLNLSQYEWGFSEEYTHTPERLMAGRDVAGYYFMIKNGKISGGAGVPEEYRALPGFHVKVEWGLIAHPSASFYGREGQRQRSADAAVLRKDLEAAEAAGKGSDQNPMLSDPIWPKGIGEALSVDAENGGGLPYLTAKRLKPSPEVNELPQTAIGVPVLTEISDEQKEAFYKSIGR